MSLDILLPFYGDPTLMRTTVSSVLAQSDRHWHLVVVDDGFPDPSIPDWFANLGDDRIEYHRNDHNLGANANYRRALALASAQHIVFLGADDVLMPTYVARFRSVLAEYGSDLAMYHPGVKVIDEAGHPARSASDRVKRLLRPHVPKADLLAGEMLASSLLRGNWTYFPSICWQRDLVESVGFRSGLHVVQDLAMILDLTARGHVLVLDPHVTFAYRRHSGSDSSVKAMNGERFAEEAAFFARAAEEMHDLGWTRAERAAKQHVTSRLNALSLVPTALKARERRAAVGLVRHVLGTRFKL